jgi:hypothetical protein
MSTPLRESVLAAAAARLASVVRDVKVERARRAPPAEAEFPLLAIIGGGAVPDYSQSPGETFWTFGFTVIGYAQAASDLAAERALTTLHARVMAALENTDLGPAAVQPTAGAAQFGLYAPDESKTPAGEFSVSFQALAIAPTSSPYAP